MSSSQEASQSLHIQSTQFEAYEIFYYNGVTRFHRPGKFLLLVCTKSFARFATPLNRKLGKDQPRAKAELSEKRLEALEMLKEKLISPPPLALPQSQGTYMI